MLKNEEFAVGSMWVVLLMTQSPQNTRVRSSAGSDGYKRQIYNVTGNGVEGTRDLYAVRGLRVAEDKTIGMPCERTGSRWIPIPCTGAHTTIDQTVHAIF